MLRKANKRGLSEMVSYVLLIVIAITIAALVYEWLVHYVWKPQDVCEEGVSLTIKSFDCANSIINITLINTGTWSVDGFNIRATNKTGKKAVYLLNAAGLTSSITEGGKVLFNEGLKPSDSGVYFFDYSSLGIIEGVEIEPLRIKDKKIILCTDAVIADSTVRCS